MNLVRRAAQQIGAGMSISDLDRMMDAAYGGSPSYTGKLVSQTTALAVSAVWGCINGLANDIAKMPLLTYQANKDWREPFKEHYLWSLLLQEANPEMTAYRFKHLAQTWVGLWGNAFAEMEINGRGQVTALWPWRPDHVRVSREYSGGPLQYSYRMKNGKVFTVPQERMLHLRGMSVDGVMGLSPIDVHKQTVGLSMAITQHGGAFFANGARPLGLLQHPGHLDDKAYLQLKNDWDDQHRGLDNAHRVAILEEGMTWKEAGLDMVDAAYIESYKLTAEDIARIYNFPQHRLGLLDRATNNNIQQLALEYVMYNLGPWTECWTQEIEFALLSTRERQTVSVGFDFTKMLLGDYQSMGQFIGTMRQWGILNADEVRQKFLDMGPQPNGVGKTYLEPVNMMPAQGDEPRLPGFNKIDPNALDKSSTDKPNEKPKPNGLAH